MEKTYTIKFGSYVVRDESGAVNSEATLERFDSEFNAWLVNVEAQTALIAGAVTAVFDTHRGANINMPALVSLAMGTMTVNLTNYGELSEKVHEYVQDRKGTEFHIAKGKGGGVRRISDIPAEEYAKILEAEAKRAAAKKSDSDD